MSPLFKAIDIDNIEIIKLLIEDKRIDINWATILIFI